MLLGASLSPSSSTSLTSGGYSSALWCSGASIVSSAMLTTNSRLSNMLRAVSFSTPARRPMPMPTIGGFGHTSVKALKGGTLTSPAAERVVIHAMGLGTMDPTSSL